jgi:AcrR family transcriptional regulator
MPAIAPVNGAPPRQRRKEARPLELLEAGLALFVEKGFAATRAEEIAARAGVSKGTLYLYYPSKEELLKAVIREWLVGQIAEGAAQIQAFDGPSAALLRELFTRWWLHVFESPASGVFKLVITEVRNFPDIAEFYRREVIEAGERLIAEVIERGIARGEFRAVEVPLVVHSLCLPMVMLCLHKHSLGACSPVPTLMEPLPFIRQHVELVLRGLAADSAPQPRRTAAPLRRAAADSARRVRAKGRA